MARLCLWRTVGILLEGACLLIELVHLIGISVVGGNYRNALCFVNSGDYSCELEIECLHGADSRLVIACVTHHIAVREVGADILIFSGFNGFDKLVSDDSALHPRALFERNDIGGNLLICFRLVVELSASVSVPEVCHMSVFLRFGDSKLRNACSGKVFAHCICDMRRRNKVSRRNMQVAVIFKHAGINNFRHTHAVEFVEIGTALERF